MPRGFLNRAEVTHVKDIQIGVQIHQNVNRGKKRQRKLFICEMENEENSISENSRRAFWVCEKGAKGASEVVNIEHKEHRFMLIEF